MQWTLQFASLAESLRVSIQYLYRKGGREGDWATTKGCSRQEEEEEEEGVAEFPYTLVKWLVLCLHLFRISREGIPLTSWRKGTFWNAHTMPSEKKRNPFALRHYNMELGKGCTRVFTIPILTRGIARIWRSESTRNRNSYFRFYSKLESFRTESYRNFFFT